MKSDFGKQLVATVFFLVGLSGCKGDENKSLVEKLDDAKSSLFGATVEFTCDRLAFQYHRNLFNEKLSIKNNHEWKVIPFHRSGENEYKLQYAGWTFTLPESKLNAFNTKFNLPLLNQKPFSISSTEDFFETPSIVDDVPVKIDLDFKEGRCIATNLQEVIVETTFLVDRYIKVHSRVPVPLECALASSLENCIESAMPSQEMLIKKLWAEYDVARSSRAESVKGVVNSVPLKTKHTLATGELVERFALQSQ